jgi:glycosyltransferase involved in cell wall biosynthesis
MPFIRRLCLYTYVIARPIDIDPRKEKSVSVIIAAMNEKGNIESAVLRTPKMGESTEIIFVEGGSKDGTYEEIIRVSKKYSNNKGNKKGKISKILYAKQDGKGKGDAVRKGFDMATGDILMILDADLTVPPEDLPKFYEAIASNKGEFINGTRLVYPMEDQAMRTLNIIVNRAFSIIFTWILDQRFKDTLCGTKVISKKNYEKLKAGRLYFGNFDPFGDFDLIFGASKLNLKVIEVPIRYGARTYGSSNIQRFKHGWLLLKMCIFAMKKIKFK